MLFRSALGLTVTGFVDAGTAIRKSGMNPGDILVLTKPLGTGALFAADMRCKAKGRWVCAALCSMTQSNRAAADCFIGYGTTAMTDVSGFGLLGHLVEMTKASGVATTVTLDIVPALEGTLEVMDKGIFSSLHAENVRLRRAISGLEKAARNPVYPLIFDPQTAGGLLASVPLIMRRVASTHYANSGTEVRLRSARFEKLMRGNLQFSCSFSELRKRSSEKLHADVIGAARNCRESFRCASRYDYRRLRGSHRLCRRGRLWQ